LETSYLELYTDTCRPWFVKIEQECNRKLFPPAQRRTFYVEHLVDSKHRMDWKSRAESYKAYIEMGVMDADQVARMENLPKPKPKPEPPAPVVVTPAPADGPDPAMEAPMRALLVDAVARYARREAEQARRAAKRGPAAFEAWCAELGAEAAVLSGMLAAPLGVALRLRGVKADPGEVAGVLARSYVEQSRDELLALPAKDLELAAERTVTAWQTSRPLALAERALEWRT
jgi:hypothetical protein